MAAKPYQPCSLRITVDLVTEVLIWDNSRGEYDCTASKRRPALEYDTYFIPAGEAVPAVE